MSFITNHAEDHALALPGQCVARREGTGNKPRKWQLAQPWQVCIQVSMHDIKCRFTSVAPLLWQIAAAASSSKRNSDSGRPLTRYSALCSDVCQEQQMQHHLVHNRTAITPKSIAKGGMFILPLIWCIRKQMASTGKTFTTRHAFWVKKTLINKVGTIIKCCSYMNLMLGSHVHYADTYK